MYYIFYILFTSKRSMEKLREFLVIYTPAVGKTFNV